MPRELEFKFLNKDSEDEKALDELSEAQFKSGRITLNDTRERLGLSPYDFAEADMPMVVTQRGIVFLEGASEVDVAGELIQPMEAPRSTAPPEGQNALPGSATSQKPVKSAETATAPNRATADDKKKTELSAYHRW